MRICLVAHGYPPELVGGTEKSVQNLARGLARRGHEVLVVAGSMEHEEGFRSSTAEDADPVSGARLRVQRIHRADLYFDHWQKSVSARVGEAFHALLERERPDVVHVHHWIRLSRDLVAWCARAGVPAIVTCHDLWTTCLIAFRVRPNTEELCEAPLAPQPCIDCAGAVAPRTPWVARENLHLALAERRTGVLRELTLAHAVVVPSQAHAAAIRRFLGLSETESSALDLRVLPHGRDLVLAPRAPKAAPGKSGRLVLASWSHIHPLKGTDILLAAIQRLPDPGRVELHLAGGEPDAAYAMRVHAMAQGLNVHFHGAFDEEELAGHRVRDAHLMVSATRAFESWGLVLDEAAALRLPMVLPRTGAFVERLAEGDGVLFYDARDPDSLAAALTRVLDEDGLLAELRRGLPPVSELVPGVDEHVERAVALYAEAVEAGAPAVPALDWWQTKLRNTTEEQWDQSLTQRSAEELGFA